MLAVSAATNSVLLSNGGYGGYGYPYGGYGTYGNRPYVSSGYINRPVGVYGK